MGLVIAVILGSSAIFAFGSPHNALLWLRGERITVVPTVAVVDLSGADDTVTVSFAITNLSFSELTISGARAHCACTVAQDLPARIPAFGECSVAVQIDRATAPANLEETIIFFVDGPDERMELLVQVRAI